MFKEKYYSIEKFEFEGLSGKVRVVLPEALIVLKLDIYSNPTYSDEKREKHWKGMVDIYSLFMGSPTLRIKVFENFYNVKPFSFEHLEMFFSKESRELMDVVSIITDYVGIPFDREGSHS
ncbi:MULTISPECIES: hypothetical protein [Thermococcus]|uniref:Uncharacterized protein n=1 Tax=Thermococcus sibiricus (strain DSM 12597 / MM 739) TaxID=604354 RepID=C6A5I1_THESM|nr:MULTISPECIES: hypothetical protein [Thermococcus]ACS90876.1 hypothetical protein TSIB_1825 [Thermococcus sibiricus MM 739]MBC7094102.1 hypothetical protein [Thermococcus sp.]